jgi:sortase (surface protein transpeptidase)
MASTDHSESAKSGWLHPHPVLPWVALVGAVAALLVGMAYMAKLTSKSVTGSTGSSKASDVTNFAPQFERPLLMRGGVPNPIRPSTSTGHIFIPAIGVDASLIPLGLTPRRTLEVPKDWGVAGWFEGGPFPGERGPAVVVGHVDSTSGPAVFYRLPELEPGDMIVAWRKGGVRSRFRVVSLRWFSKSDFPTQLVYRSTATPALRLITCGGEFDSSTGHYVDNLVVFASPLTSS